jgi:AcrR family transcriptional regulator
VSDQKDEQETERRPRADALANRARLIEAAKAAFAETGPDATLEEIARRAGVGIGTLYRHFPTRHAIVEAVYLREVTELAAAADRLLAEKPPAEAMHAWMRLFIDYIATKRLMYSAVSATMGAATPFAATGEALTNAAARLFDAARAAGQIRADAQPADIMRGLIGLAYNAGEPDWQASAERLVDILMAGLRTG